MNRLRPWEQGYFYKSASAPPGRAINHPWRSPGIVWWPPSRMTGDWSVRHKSRVWSVFVARRTTLSTAGSGYWACGSPVRRLPAEGGHSHRFYGSLCVSWRTPAPPSLPSGISQKSSSAQGAFCTHTRIISDVIIPTATFLCLLFELSRAGSLRPWPGWVAWTPPDDRRDGVSAHLANELKFISTPRGRYVLESLSLAQPNLSIHHVPNRFLIVSN